MAVRYRCSASPRKADRWLDGPLAEKGGKGLFISELETALDHRRADLAVHSMKDVPADLPEPFALGCIGYRADPRDAVVSRSGARLSELAPGSVVGTSSVRRTAELLSLRPDLAVKPVRGNVDTRLAKLDNGDYDALLLACAGLERLGLAGRIAERLAVQDFVPSPGQGALGLECRSDDLRMRERLGALENPDERERVQAERAVASALGADCATPLGVHVAPAPDGGVRMDVHLLSVDATESIRLWDQGPNAPLLAEGMVRMLRERGADDLLQSGTPSA